MRGRHVREDTAVVAADDRADDRDASTLPHETRLSSDDAFTLIADQRGIDVNRKRRRA
jgi:hypothetical protein